MTIEEYLKKHNMKPSKLEIVAGISQSTITRYLRGGQKLGELSLSRLRALGIEENGESVKMGRKPWYIEAQEAPEGTVAKYLLDNDMTMTKLSELTGIQVSSISQHVNGKTKLHETNREKLRKLGIYDFDTRVVRARGTFKKRVGNVEREDDVVIETIEYIIKARRGTAYRLNRIQAEEVAYWLQNRGYRYKKIKTNYNVYEIKFAKVGKG